MTWNATSLAPLAPSRGGAPRRLRTARATLAALGPLALVAAGCGGAPAPSVANIATTTSPAASAASASQGATGSKAAAPTPRSAAALVTCLEQHGLSATPGGAGTGAASASSSSPTIDFAGVTVSGANPDSAQFRSAVQACRKDMPGGGPPSQTPAEQAATAKAMLAFAVCMRAHGVPGFPDPNGQGIFPFAAIRAIDPDSPLVQTAFNACVSLEPKHGPHFAI